MRVWKQLSDKHPLRSRKQLWLTKESFESFQKEKGSQKECANPENPKAVIKGVKIHLRGRSAKNTSTQVVLTLRPIPFVKRVNLHHLE